MDGPRAFERACRAAVRLWPVQEGRERIREAKLRSAWVDLSERVRRSEREPGSAGTRALGRLRRERDRLARVLEQPAFRSAVRVTGMDLRVPDVLRFASLTAIGAGILAGAFLCGSLLAGLPPAAVASLAALTLAVPGIAYLAVASYPEVLARRISVRSLGSAPEAVSYLAMSMRLVPALDRAVEFAAQHTREPLAGRLRAVLWSVYTRDAPGIEPAFSRFVREWGGDREDLKRSLLAVANAGREGTVAGIDRTLDKAREIAYGDTRSRMREYAARLRGPTTVLYALGVLLPLVVGSLLPVLSLTGLSPMSGTGGPASSPDVTVPVVLAMDVGFPAAALAYAWHILGRRPGADPEGEGLPISRRHAVPALLVGGVGLAFAASGSGILAVLLGLWGIVLGAMLVLVPGLREVVRRRTRTSRLEEEFPDAMFLVGTRVSEGMPVEHALRSAAAALPGTPVAELFEGVAHRAALSRGGLEEAVTDPEGPVGRVPSRSVRAALRMIVDVGRNDPATAGAAIVDASAYFRDLREVDREIRRDLSSVVDAMESTSAFFAPLVLGVTCALFGVLAGAFAGLVEVGMSEAAFTGAIGVYLLSSVAVASYFATGVSHGPDPTALRLSLARSLPLALGVFTLSLAVSRLALG